MLKALSKSFQAYLLCSASTGLMGTTLHPMGSPNLSLYPMIQKNSRSFQSPHLSGSQMDFILPVTASLLKRDFWGHFTLFFFLLPFHTLTTKHSFLPDRMQVEMKVRIDSSFLKSYLLLLLWAHYWNSRHSSPFRELMRVILHSWNTLMFYLLLRDALSGSLKQLGFITQF